MKKQANKSIFIVTVLLAIVCIAVALIMFTMNNSERINSQNREYLVDNAVQVAGSIDQALSDGYDNIKVLSSLVSNSLTGPEFDISIIQEMTKDSIFDFMEFADATGVDHNITGGVSDARDRQYYLDAKDGNSGMELIYVSRATHETLLMFYSPIYYEDEFVGSLVGAYQAANRITKLLSTEYFGEAATSYLATPEGRIIASNQGFDPTHRLYVTDLVNNDYELEMELAQALDSDETLTFTLDDNATGGCMMKLPENGWYLIQIFPKAASTRMIFNANKLGYQLVGFLVAIYIVVLIAIIEFYRNQQIELENARQQAEIANQAKSTFLFNMSHDIRTPMNAITGFTDKAIRHKGDPEVLEESLKKVQASSNYLVGIVNDILDMAKIESGKLELNREVHYSRAGTNAMMEIFAAEAARKDITLSSEIKNVTNDYLWVDESRVKQITANLLSNAVKYTNPGGHIWHIVEQVPCDKPGYARFVTTVKDTGKGMSPEFLEKVFDEFEREQSSTKSGEQGTGLGMAIVKRLIEKMDGSIDVQSEPGVGTTIKVTMEHKIASDEEIAKYKEEHQSRTSAAQVDLSGKRVLVVEDNELNREIAVDLLEESGLLVETAEDGSVAVEKLKEIAARGDYSYYDAVLMDIQMPVMDGYEATRIIRAMPVPEGIRMPIIAMTANAFEEDKQNALAAGMDDHIAKPIDAKKLWSTLNEIIKKRYGEQ